MTANSIPGEAQVVFALMGIILIRPIDNKYVFNTIINRIFCCLLVLVVAFDFGLAFIPIAPNVKSKAPPKIYGIGLSRTGTTSLAGALADAGFYSYHAPFYFNNFTSITIDNDDTLPSNTANSKLPEINDEWNDAFEALNDIQVSLVYGELAKRYKTSREAKFILTKRDPKLWGAGAHKFFSLSMKPLCNYCESMDKWTGGRGYLSPGCGSRFCLLFDMVYSPNWKTFNEKDWELLYVAFEEKVKRFFLQREKNAGPNRFLEIDLTNNEGWEKLGPFLGIPEEQWPKKKGQGVRKVDVYESFAYGHLIMQLKMLKNWVVYYVAKLLRI